MQAETTEVTEKANVRREQQRRATSRAQVLARLEKASATTVDLNEICYRFGARILELRRQGYCIITTPIGRGLFNYQLDQHESAAVAVE